MIRKSKYLLKGNTLMEVLIALTVISCCAALASVIYLNIQKSALPFFKIKAIELAETIAERVNDPSSRDEESTKVEEFTIKKKFSPHPEFPDCMVMRIIVFDVQLKKIHELESVVFYGQ